MDEVKFIVTYILMQCVIYAGGWGSRRAGDST